MVILTNPDYPHSAEISRTGLSEYPPFTATVTVLWTGSVDCQVNQGGGTAEKQSVFVSDYTIYSKQINQELQTGDIITLTLGLGKTPFKCTIEQSSTEDVWEEDGVKYGTTIWANQVKA